MHSLQILDSGETFLRQLDPRPLLIGSGPKAELRLEEEGVCGIHARLSPVEGQWQIEALDPAAELRVNGETCRRAELRLGDRIEIGAAVLVLGKQVQRPARAGDLLERSGEARPAVTRRRGGSGRGTTVAVVMIALAGIVFLAVWARGESGRFIPDTEREQITVARKRGDFDAALQHIRRLEESWADGQPARLQQLAEARRRVERTEQKFEELYTTFMAEAPRSSYLEQNKRMQQLRRSADQAVAEAASLLGSNLTAYREKVLTKLAAARRKVEGAGRAVTSPGGGTAERVPEWFATRFAQAKAHLTKKEYLQGLDLVRASLAGLPKTETAQMVTLLQDLRAAAREEGRQLVEKAFALERAGELQAAVRLLQAQAHRYPKVGDLSMLRRELERFEAQAGMAAVSEAQLAARRPKLPVQAPPKQAPGVPQAPGNPAGEAGQKAPALEGEVAGLDREPGPALRPKSGDMGKLDRSEIRSTEAEADSLLAEGDLAAAIECLETKAEEFGGVSDRLARYLRSRAADLRLVRRSVEAALASGRKPLSLPLNIEKQSAAFLALEAGLVKLKIDSKVERLIAWTSLPFDVVHKLAEAFKLAPLDCLGIVTLGYWAGEPEAAEAYLVKLLGREPKVQRELTALISRGRGEVVDDRGYALVDGAFVARRFVTARKLARDYERRLARVLNKDQAARNQLLGELRTAADAGAGDALVLALRQLLEKSTTKLKKHPLRRRFDLLAGKRRALDKARAHAKALIYDTKTYFYPYKPPQVSGARHAEYNKVQKEVNLRVAAVKKLWRDKTNFKMGSSLRAELAGVLWLADQLEAMSELAPAGSQRVAWLRAVPPVATLNLKNFCRNEDEVKSLRHYMDIEAYNEELAEQLRPGEIDQLNVTNSYRMMFGHRPLAMNLQAHKAAQAHADEMSSLGYFSHHSPVPENKTPYDRMRKAGYQYGISENIALNPSAPGAHLRWCHSSGHHRNLLHPDHTEVGIGNTGRYWVQNFGRGSEYRERDEFPR